MKKLLLTIACLLSLEVMQSNAQCGAGFTWFINSTTPTFVMFYDSSYGAGNLLYQWDFGDGATDTAYNPSHVYAGNGSYYVCLTITDTAGCTNTVCDSVIVQIPPPTVDVYHLMLDSMAFFICTAPANVSFYYGANLTGYNPSDSATFEINYGDGTDSTFKLPLTNSNFYGTLTHAYLNPGNYNVQLVVTGPDLLADSASSQPVVISSTCGSVSGKVYNDLNGNCAYDSGEEMQNVSLHILSSGQNMLWTNSDGNGDYSFNVPTGSTYEVHVDAYGGMFGHLQPSCPPTGIISIPTVPSTGNDFGLVCPAGYDLQGHVSGWGFRPGFIGTVCVSVYNQNCNSPASGVITLTFPSNVTPLQDTLGTPYIITGQTVTYPINDTSLYWTFCIPTSVSTGAQIGDSVCITLDIQPATGDENPLNNTGTFCFAIRNSYDPNDKAVAPAGEGVQGSILPNTDLTYTIRFQNTGNAEAINIYILDSLDANLDETSVEIIGTSHDVSMSLLAGRVLRFNYDNIMLLDSNANEPASHGYVAYRIKQNVNVPQLSTIENTAGIYFDFNPPIITNTTLNTVDWTLSTPSIENQSSILSAYPNPSNDKCQLLFSNNLTKVVTVIDAVGKEVFSATVSTDNYLLNTLKFADGIYTIRILENGIASGNLKLMILH